jgi:Flp pilus assembly protein TadG
MAAYWKSNLGSERSGPAKKGLLKRAGRGQILVILSVLVPIMLGVVAMAVDISTFDWTWARMQAAADAAVAD